MLRSPALRTRFVLIVLVGAVLPLALIGFWLAQSSLRSGEELLTARLDESLEGTARGVRRAWNRRRSDLLTLGDEPIVQQRLAARLVFDDDPAQRAILDDAVAKPGVEQQVHAGLDAHLEHDDLSFHE